MSSSLLQESEDLLAGTGERYVGLGNAIILDYVPTIDRCFSLHQILSAPQQQGSDDEDEEELTPAEVVQRMKVGLLPLSTFG